jgi:nitroreductase
MLMDVYQAINKRRSIRKFKDIPLPYAMLEKCVDAARLAPSAMNCQLCRYVVVDDESLLPAVLNAVNVWSGVPKPKQGWSPEGRPRAYIVSLIDTGLETELGASRTNSHYDAGLAMENMALVALGQGLGSCVLSGIDRDRLRQVLNIPPRYEVAMMLALGFADESPVPEVAAGSVTRWRDDRGVLHVPKRKLEDILHRNGFPQA